ncbi:MAG: SDR family oxidoreductase [Candidatus Chryseobacterium colombiense]|nr:SDR family oxidoreductase [Chryseobacterium sp.]WEK70303.1 MAG: SDR family oxidoreductase [Chryseobacterium sp.]
MMESKFSNFKTVMNRVGDVPLGRMSEPDEIANLVTYLVSSESRYITKQII